MINKDRFRKDENLSEESDSDSNYALIEGDMISDRYKIISEVATTELSATYVAEDTGFNRIVTLKHVFKKNESDDFKALVKEAHLLSTLTHPNVITVFDYTIDANGAYVISEYLSGETLEELVLSNQITLALFVSLVEQMLLGLGEAHRRGIVHGDIQPSNVMILQQPDGTKQVKLVDFGLSHVVTGSDSGGAFQSMNGSVYFMSPEEFNGAPKSILSDIYSLGCVCYYMITGSIAFHGDDAEQVMDAHMQHRLHEPVALLPDLPLVMNQWLLWMVNFRPETRPADTNEALVILGDCCEEIQDSNAQQILPHELVQESIDAADEVVRVETVKVFEVSEETKAVSPSEKEDDSGIDDWTTIHNMALHSFTKLVGKPQASKFMVQILTKHNFDKNEVVPRDLWEEVITDYFALIPNRKKRAYLMQEIAGYL